MKTYIVYDKDGRILRTGICPDHMSALQASGNEFVMEGSANDVTQKIKFEPSGPKIIDKTPKEIEAEKPSEIPEEQKPAPITKGQWQSVLDRLAAGEVKLNALEKR